MTKIEQEKVNEIFKLLDYIDNRLDESMTHEDVINSHADIRIIECHLENMGLINDNL